MDQWTNSDFWSARTCPIPMPNEYQMGRMVYENALCSKKEHVKCIVVGDAGVGKTQLLYTKSTNLTPIHLPKWWHPGGVFYSIRNTKVPVPEPGEKLSIEVVDDVKVCMQYKDTFGAPGRNRKEDYDKVDVVLLCFCVGSRDSLRHCESIWLPEIKQFAPNTAIILVGCKNDYRNYVVSPSCVPQYCSADVNWRADDVKQLVTFDEARDVASKIGSIYYETSSLTKFGIVELFRSVIRLTLLNRKKSFFLSGHLKKIKQPNFQVPDCPPRPEPILLDKKLDSSYVEDIKWLFETKNYSDVVIVTHGARLEAHSCILAAGSSVFYDALREKLPFHLAQNARLVKSTSETDIDKYSNYYEEEEKCGGSTETMNAAITADYESFTHFAFDSIKMEQCITDGNTGTIRTKLVFTLNKLFTVDAIEKCLRYIYIGDLSINEKESNNIQLIMNFVQAAEILGLYVVNSLDNKRKVCLDIKHTFINNTGRRLRNFSLSSQFVDVDFQLDDGIYRCHKAILCARSEVFRTMFDSDFAEKSQKMIKLPGVRYKIFHGLMTYVYLDVDVGPSISWENYSEHACQHLFGIYEIIELLELCNRLQLQRFMCVLEKKIIDELRALFDKKNASHDALRYCLELAGPAAILHATDLTNVCLSFILPNYDTVKTEYGEEFENLPAKLQEYLDDHRWPPLWYLKEMEYVRSLDARSQSTGSFSLRSLFCWPFNNCIR